MSMRVLVVTSLYLSGNGNWVAEQVRSLRAAGLEVDVVFFDTRRTRLNYVLSVPAIARALRAHRYDIIHSHHTYTLLDVMMAKRLVGSTIPVVLTNHESEIVDRRSRTWHPTSYLRHSLAVKRYAAQRADFIIYVSRQLADGLRVQRPFDIIPCGVDLEKFRPLPRDECRRAIGLPVDATVLFFPADPRNKRKRFELTESAYRIVRDRLLNAVLVTGGGIDADQMPLYFNAADVIVQTSYGEASPTVIKEALACEVPVVSTDVGDTRDILTGLSHCIVCSEDAEVLAEQIVTHAGTRPAGAREHLRRQHLALEQVARRIVTVYERTLAH